MRHVCCAPHMHAYSALACCECETWETHVAIPLARRSKGQQPWILPICCSSMLTRSPRARRRGAQHGNGMRASAPGAPCGSAAATGRAMCAVPCTRRRWPGLPRPPLARRSSGSGGRRSSAGDRGRGGDVIVATRVTVATPAIIVISTCQDVCLLRPRLFSVRKIMKYVKILFTILIL